MCNLTMYVSYNIFVKYTVVTRNEQRDEGYLTIPSLNWGGFPSNSGVPPPVQDEKKLIAATMLTNCYGVLSSFEHVLPLKCC